MTIELVSCSTTVHHPTQIVFVFIFSIVSIMYSLPFIFVGLGNFFIMSFFLLISFPRLILSGISFPVVKWLLNHNFFIG